LILHRFACVALTVGIFHSKWECPCRHSRFTKSSTFVEFPFFSTSLEMLLKAPAKMSDNGGDDQAKMRRQEKERILELCQQREALELEGSAIVSELTTSPGVRVDPMNESILTPIPPPGIDTPLVDREGYPRDDIDLYRVRALRQRLAVIRTDYERLQGPLQQLVQQQWVGTSEEEMKQRQAPKPKPRYDSATGKWVVANWDGTVSGVANGHERQFEEIGREPPNVPLASTPTPLVQRPPLAVVNSVAPDSPAARAGLQPRDVVVEFGTATSLQQIGELVAASVGRDIGVQVQRHNQIISLQLQPQTWAGRGLLGCHLLPPNV
jgi:26S proteasome regulatory subunit N4